MHNKVDAVERELSLGPLSELRCTATRQETEIERHLIRRSGGAREGGLGAAGRTEATAAGLQMVTAGGAAGALVELEGGGSCAGQVQRRAPLRRAVRQLEKGIRGAAGRPAAEGK